MMVTVGVEVGEDVDRQPRHRVEPVEDQDRPRAPAPAGGCAGGWVTRKLNIAAPQRTWSSSSAPCVTIRCPAPTPGDDQRRGSPSSGSTRTRTLHEALRRRVLLEDDILAVGGCGRRRRAAARLPLRSLVVAASTVTNWPARRPPYRLRWRSGSESPGCGRRGPRRGRRASGCARRHSSRWRSRAVPSRRSSTPLPRAATGRRCGR
jgi:hypothetical protein